MILVYFIIQFKLIFYLFIQFQLISTKILCTSYIKELEEQLAEQKKLLKSVASRGEEILTQQSSPLSARYLSCPLLSFLVIISISFYQRTGSIFLT